MVVVVGHVVVDIGSESREKSIAARYRSKTIFQERKSESVRERERER